MVRDPGVDFDDWYLGAHGRLVAALVSFSGSLEVASDAVDEACARALGRWSRVGGMSSVDAWVYRVAINHAKRRMRRAALERSVLSRVSARPAVAASLDGPAGEIWDVVGRLPLRQRTAVVLRYVADLPEAEIARVMKVSRGTVASTLADARRRLGDELSDAEEVPHA